MPFPRSVVWAAVLVIAVVVVIHDAVRLCSTSGPDVAVRTTTPYPRSLVFPRTSQPQALALVGDPVATKSRAGRAAPKKSSRAARIAVLSFFTQPSDKPRTYKNFLAQATQRNKQIYCDYHGYDLIWEDASVVYKKRPPHWGKIVALVKWLPHYDWVMWIDADALIMNYAVRIEDIIKTYARPPRGQSAAVVKPDFLVSSDRHFINTGIFLLKKTPRAYRFLREVFNSPPSAWVAWEQGGVNYVLKNETYLNGEFSIGNMTRIVPNQVFNSYPRGWCIRPRRASGFYKRGHFIVHFPHFGGCVKRNHEVVFEGKNVTREALFEHFLDLGEELNPGFPLVYGTRVYPPGSHHNQQKSTPTADDLVKALLAMGGNATDAHPNGMNAAPPSR